MTTIRTPGRSARHLPVGTLTLVFTDIEGSTRLELAVGTDRYAALLDRHRALLREAWAAADGIEIGTEGDSFFVVFERPSAAVAAAVAGQRALAAEAWPKDGGIRVRMGVHTGEVARGEMGYVGTAINRAARIAASAHGGQVLLSSTTRSLVADGLPDGVTIRDLGAHRLKDLPQPERLFQLVIAGLPSEFPPLRGEVGDSLPVQLTSFVGRETELATVERLLATSRLLTLTGPGGTGKTRLAIALANRAADMFPDGVVFVPLAPIDDAVLVPATIARALSIGDTGARPPLDLVIEQIGEKRLLLVLDNFEQVLSAAPVIAEILRRTPNSTILLTSRAVLHLTGEQEYEVPGLPAPPDVDRLPAAEIARIPAPLRRSDPEAVGRFEAVRLFVARARAVRPDFELDESNAAAVARITARLHGMPLPIELAAARVKLHEPAAVLARLDDQLGLLASASRDTPERQRSIRGAIAWSVGLLAPTERTLLARLGAFVGGFDFASAVAVAGGDGLAGPEVEDGIAALVDQSLATRSGTVPGRFVMLEPIREYAVELLAAAGELQSRRDRHAERFLALAEEAGPHLAGDDQAAWLDRLDAERDNLRAAVGWAIERPLPVTALRLGSTLWRFWQKRGYLDEGGTRLATILAADWSRDDPALRAKALEALGGIRYWQGRIADATGPYAEATAIWRALGDRRELANALYNESYAWSVDDRTYAMPLLDEATRIYRELGDDAGLGNVLWAAGTNHLQRAEAAAAEPLFAEARDRFRRAGDRTMEAWADHMLGAAYAVLGQPDEALRTFGAALDHFVAVGDVSGIALALGDFGVAARAFGKLETAARLDLMARTLARAIGANILDASASSFPGIWSATTPEELPPGRYEAIAAEVAALSLDEMVAYARSIPGAERSMEGGR